MAVRRAVEAAPGFGDELGGGVSCGTGNEHIGKIGAGAEELIKRERLTGRKHGDGLRGKAALQKAGIVGKGDGDGQHLADVEAVGGVKGLFP